MKIIYFFLFITVFLLTSSLFSTSYSVKTNGDNTFSGTNWAEAWRTISHAASNAIVPGDIVYIADGVYFEQVKVQASGVAGNPIIFTGTNTSQQAATIDGGGIFENCFCISNKSYIEVKNINFIHSDSAGIRIEDNSFSNKIINTRSYSNNSWGIICDNDNNNMIISNIISHNSQYGIYLFECQNIIVKNNLICSNDNGSGIVLTDLFGKICKNNQIINNQIYGPNQGTGIYLASGRSNIIISNTFYKNDTGISCIGNPVFGNASYTRIINNDFISNESFGMTFGPWAPNSLVSNNYIFGYNQDVGIDLYSAKQNGIISNIIYKNQTGIGLRSDPGFPCTGNQLLNNTVYSNTLYGISIVQGDTSGNTVRNNRIWGQNQDYGINLMDAINNVIQSNVINRNQKSGIYLRGTTSDHDILQNQISSNSEYGIYSTLNITDNDIIGNKIIGNQNAGIYISAINYNNFMGNEVKNNKNSGISITGADRNYIQSNFIGNNTPHGIYVLGNTYQNVFRQNTIFSNSGSGIFFNGSTADQNYVRSNIIYGKNQTNGIHIRNGDNDIIANKIQNNIIGINIDRGNGSIVQYNNIYSNITGIVWSNCNADCSRNSITNNEKGVWHRGGIFSNFTKNNIYNNTIANFTNSAGSPVLVTNNWWDSTIASVIQTGIKNNGGYSNFSPYRLFDKVDINPNADTDSFEPITAISIQITNMNQVFLRWNNQPGVEHYNIYWSTNAGTTNLQHSPGSMLDVIAYTTETNYIHTNPIQDITNYYYITASDSATPHTNESWYSATLKIFVPKIHTGPYYVDDDSGDDFNIGTFDEPFRTIQKAADKLSSGTFVSSATCYLFPGSYPEQVYIASNNNPGYMVFIKLSNTAPVLNGSLASNCALKITNASRIIISGLDICNYSNGIIIDGNSTNNLIQGNTIYSNFWQGIQINSDSADNNTIRGNTISGPNQVSGIIINDGDYNTIISNTVDHSTVGIVIASNASYNNIFRNSIYSNTAQGIHLSSGPTFNTIGTNIIFGWNQDYGVILTDVENNTIISNRIFCNQLYGIYSWDFARYNNIINNTIYSNNNAGIYLDAGMSDFYLIKNNSIYGLNQTYGIELLDSDWNTILSNDISLNQNTGIYLNGTSADNNIYNNMIQRNGVNGVCINSSGISIINCNNINNNIHGICYSNSLSSIYQNSFMSNTVGFLFNNSGLGKFTKNNLVDNTINVSNASAGVIKLTNNWWGTTIASEIQLTIKGQTGYSNFTPYRLFNKVNIISNADNERLPTLFAATCFLSNDVDVNLIWNRADNTAGDFSRYFIYRTNTPGYTNLTRNNVKIIINNINTTNYIDNPGIGSWYYYITALDDPAPPVNSVYTNESWYCQINGSITIKPHIITLITNINYPDISITGSSNNVPVLSFKITDKRDHNFQAIKIINTGDMTNSRDIESFKLWFDVNNDYNWDISDQFITNASWNAVKNKWIFSPLSIQSGTNLLGTIDIAPTAVNGKTFRAKILTADVICENSGTNINIVSNTGTITLTLPHKLELIKTDIQHYQTAASMTNQPVLAFKYYDTYADNLSELKISIIGNISAQTDIQNMKIFYDKGILGQYDISDVYITNLYYSSNFNKWTEFLSDSDLFLN